MDFINYNLPIFFFPFIVEQGRGNIIIQECQLGISINRDFQLI